MALERAGHVSACRTCAGQRLMALEGTEYVSSPEIHGARGSQRTHAHGRVTSVPQAITPVMVAPGQHAVIPLEPACITPPEGQAQQECAQVAAKRGLERQAGRSPHNARRSSRTSRWPWPTAPGGGVTHAESLRMSVPYGAGVGRSTVPAGAARPGGPANLFSGPAGVDALPPVCARGPSTRLQAAATGERHASRCQRALQPEHC